MVGDGGPQEFPVFLLHEFRIFFSFFLGGALCEKV